MLRGFIWKCVRRLRIVQRERDTISYGDEATTVRKSRGRQRQKEIVAARWAGAKPSPVGWRAVNMPHIPIVEQIRDTNAQRQRTKDSVFAIILVASGVALTAGVLIGMALMTWGPQ